jgi:hypothetical protein
MVRTCRTCRLCRSEWSKLVGGTPLDPLSKPASGVAQGRQAGGCRSSPARRRFATARPGSEVSGDVKLDVRSRGLRHLGLPGAWMIGGVVTRHARPRSPRMASTTSAAAGPRSRATALRDPPPSVSRRGPASEPASSPQPVHPDAGHNNHSLPFASTRRTPPIRARASSSSPVSTRAMSRR